MRRSGKARGHGSARPSRDGSVDRLTNDTLQCYGSRGRHNLVSTGRHRQSRKQVVSISVLVLVNRRAPQSSLARSALPGLLDQLAPQPKLSTRRTATQDLAPAHPSSGDTLLDSNGIARSTSNEDLDVDPLTSPSRQSPSPGTAAARPFAGGARRAAAWRWRWPSRAAGRGR